jgi:hypothetical protein
MYTVIGNAVFIGDEFFTLSVIIKIEHSFSVHNLDRRHCGYVLMDSLVIFLDFFLGAREGKGEGV